MPQITACTAAAAPTRVKPGVQPSPVCLSAVVGCLQCHPEHQPPPARLLQGCSATDDMILIKGMGFAHRYTRVSRGNRSHRLLLQRCQVWTQNVLLAARAALPRALLPANTNHRPRGQVHIWLQLSAKCPQFCGLANTAAKASIALYPCSDIYELL